MKKKLLVLFLAIAAATVGAFALCGCTPNGGGTQNNGGEHEHVFTDYVSNYDATCMQDGTKTAYCTYAGCGKTDTIVDENSKLAHWFNAYIPNNDATCTEDGTKTAFCNYGCNTTDIIPDENTKLGHYYIYYPEISDYFCQYCDGNMPENELNYYWHEHGVSYSVIGIGTVKDKDIVIPETYNNLPVVSIGYEAFYNCDFIESVTIPDSVTYIGDRAFSKARSLQTINIPQNISTISILAFEECYNLESVFIDDLASWFKIKFTYEMANPLYYGAELYLDGNAVTNFAPPSSITTINSYQYPANIPIAEISIPENITLISEYAFSGCNNLTSIIIPNSVAQIDQSAFFDCPIATIYSQPGEKPDGWNDNWNSSSPVVWDCKNNNIADDGNIYIMADGIRYSLKDREATVAKQPRNLTEVEIPQTLTYKNEIYTVTRIGSDAFYNCRQLINVNIPDSVISIGSQAFAWCSKLTDIDIPDSITSIDAYAFTGCVGLTNIGIPDNVTTIEAGTFSECSELASITIPDNVTDFKLHAFASCSKLSSIYIPSNVVNISIGAFEFCNGIETITVSEDNQVYKSENNCLLGKNGESLWMGCINSRIPDGVTHIESRAFSGCKGMTCITIPNSVWSIGDNAFLGCIALSDINFNGTKAQWNAIIKEFAWDNETPNYTVTCTDGKLDKKGNVVE